MSPKKSKSPKKTQTHKLDSSSSANSPPPPEAPARGTRTRALAEGRMRVATANEAPYIFPVMNAQTHPDRTLSIFVSAYDPDGDQLQYSLTQSPAAAGIDAATGEFTWTPNWSNLGIHPVTVRVTDSRGAWSETSFTVTVANQAPQIGTLPDRTGHPEQTISFSVYAHDPDGDPITYQIVTGPPGATIDPTTGQFQWTPTWSQLGSHVITIRVKDPGGASDSDSFAITVGNQAPVMDPLANQYTMPGMPVSFPVTAMDPDGDPLTYSLVQGPSGASVDPNSGTFDWTPSPGATGCHTITIRCQDPGGAAAQQSCLVCVE